MTAAEIRAVRRSCVDCGDLSPLDAANAATSRRNPQGLVTLRESMRMADPGKEVHGFNGDFAGHGSGNQRGTAFL